jgi:predicted nucleic acid-binding protein
MRAKPSVKLFPQEEGWEAVQKILSRVEAGDLEAAISVVTLTEIYYKYMKEKRADLAEERTNQLMCALYLHGNSACPACTPSAICACHYIIFS